MDLSGGSYAQQQQLAAPLNSLSSSLSSSSPPASSSSSSASSSSAAAPASIPWSLSSVTTRRLPKITSTKLHEILRSMHPNESMEPEVEALILEMADDFVDNVAIFSAALAQHRNSKSIDVIDVAMHLDRHWQMNFPGFPSVPTTAPSAPAPLSSSFRSDPTAVASYPSIASLPVPKRAQHSQQHADTLALVKRLKDAELGIPSSASLEDAATDLSRKRRKREEEPKETESQENM